MIRRRQNDTGRGSPWQLARIERDAEQATDRRKRRSAAIANLVEIAAELHRLAERLDAGTADHAALPADLRELAEWLFAEAEGVTDGRH